MTNLPFSQGLSKLFMPSPPLNKRIGALLVATGLLFIRISFFLKLDQKWLSHGFMAQKRMPIYGRIGQIQSYFAHHLRKYHYFQ